MTGRTALSLMRASFEPIGFALSAFGGACSAVMAVIGQVTAPEISSGASSLGWSSVAMASLLFAGRLLDGWLANNRAKEAHQLKVSGLEDQLGDVKADAERTKAEALAKAEKAEADAERAKAEAAQAKREAAEAKAEAERLKANVVAIENDLRGVHETGHKRVQQVNANKLMIHDHEERMSEVEKRLAVATSHREGVPEAYREWMERVASQTGISLPEGFLAAPPAPEFGEGD